MKSEHMEVEKSLLKFQNNQFSIYEVLEYRNLNRILKTIENIIYASFDKTKL